MRASRLFHCLTPPPCREGVGGWVCSGVPLPGGRGSLKCDIPTGFMYENAKNHKPGGRHTMPAAWLITIRKLSQLHARHSPL